MSGNIGASPSLRLSLQDTNFLNEVVEDSIIESWEPLIESEDE